MASRKARIRLPTTAQMLSSECDRLVRKIALRAAFATAAELQRAWATACVGHLHYSVFGLVQEPARSDARRPLELGLFIAPAWFARIGIHIIPEGHTRCHQSVRPLLSLARPMVRVLT